MNTPFLIALMFVTILTFGIAGLLSYLADKVLHASRSLVLSKRFLWITLIMLTHLNFFWHSTLILDVEDWRFIGFLYMICGPVILFFAANFLLSHAKTQPNTDSIERRFYFFFALLEAWIIGAYPMLDQELGILVAIHAFLFLFSTTMCFTQSKWLERVFPLVAWVCVLVILFVRETNTSELLS